MDISIKGIDINNESVMSYYYCNIYNISFKVNVIHFNVNVMHISKILE